MSKNIHNEDGFSLIEIAVVIIISSFLFVIAITAYTHYLEKKRIHVTQAKIDTISNAMDLFFSTYGRYPCPASLTAGPGDANFGVETDCTAAPVAGTFVSTGQVNDDDDLTTFVNTDIRLGAIPFQTLKNGSNLFAETPYQVTFDIGAEDTVDTYKNRFSYVITENQATVNHVPRLGAVRIEDEHGQILSQNPINNHADYAVISHGQNDAGAWDFYGNRVGGACPATLPANQRENCDNDDTYVASLRYDTGPDEYDDHVSYRTWANYFLWELAAVDNTNIYNLNTGNVGIGENDPKAKLHVYEGNAVADEDAATDASILANEYCGFDPTVGGVGEDCFKPEIIASNDGLDCDDAPDHIGPHTPGNSAMVGIQSSVLSCDTIYTGPQASPACPAGQFISGFTYDPTTKTLTADCS